MRIPTILIIEHDAAIRKMYRRALQREKYQVLEADDELSALKIANNHRLDLILQGLVMPEIDSIKLNKQLRKTQNNLNVVIIALSCFLNRIAHEINNPVAWILSNLNYLKNELDQLKHAEDRLSPNFQSSITNLEHVVLESIKGTERIRDIIEPFRHVGFKADTTKSLVDIHTMLNSVIGSASLETINRAKLEKHFASNIPLIMSNSGQLHQVFLNLIINAAHAIPVGDSEHNQITVSTELETSMLRVDIQDSGSGIAPEHLAHLFEPFFSTKTNVTGTGLGLFICQGIVQNLGGEIKVQSEQGLGSVFSVYLPLNE